MWGAWSSSLCTICTFNGAASNCTATDKTFTVCMSFWCGKLSINYWIHAVYAYTYAYSENIATTTNDISKGTFSFIARIKICLNYECMVVPRAVPGTIPNNISTILHILCTCAAHIIIVIINNYGDNWKIEKKNWSLQNVYSIFIILQSDAFFFSISRGSPSNMENK